MLIEINPDNPQIRKIKQVIECLKSGGTIIYPTDTVYGFGCDIHQQKPMENICRLKNLKPEKANFSIICQGIGHVSAFTRPINNEIFRVMKQVLPGPYTFIFQTNNSVPKMFRNKKKTIGIRIPNNQIALLLVEELGSAILSSSLNSDDEIMEYLHDPEEIHEEYKNKVDMVVHGGMGGLIPSSIIDCTGTQPEILREGAGSLEIFA